MLSKNILYLLDKYQMNPTTLSKATGVPQPTIHRMIKGDVKDPRTSNIRPIAEYFNINAEVLRNTDLQASSGKDLPAFDENIAPAPLGSRPIPVISSVQAGQLVEITDSYPAGAGFDVIYTNIAVSKNAFALEIEGESMMPEFQEGDRIIVDPNVPPQPGDFVVAKNDEEAATFKKYRPKTYDASGNLIFELIPLNPDYPTLRSDLSHLYIIGVMMEHRKYRKRR